MLVRFLMAQLTRTFSSSKQEGEQESDRQEPARDADGDCCRSDKNPQNETSCDGEQIDDGNMLEEKGISDLEDDVTVDDQDQGGIQQERGSDSSNQQNRSNERSDIAGELPAGDGAVSFAGMLAIGLSIENVIQKINTTGSQTKNSKSRNCQIRLYGVGEAIRKD